MPGYTQARLDALTRSISIDRISTYLKFSGGDLPRAIQLYERNTLLSETLYSVLQGLEIAVRNSMHATLTDVYGRDWYDRAPLAKFERARIRDARRTITRNKKAETPGRIVSELTFGFWVSMTARRYAASLWVPHLHRAFPNKRLSHKLAHSRLNQVRLLRNRIAHHECILRRDLDHDYTEAVEALDWVCPETADWIQESTRFEDALQEALGRSSSATPGLAVLADSLY